MAHELWDPGLSGSGSLEAHAHDIRKYYTIRYHTILYIYYTILWGSWFLGSPLRASGINSSSLSLGVQLLGFRV